MFNTKFTVIPAEDRVDLELNYTLYRITLYKKYSFHIYSSSKEQEQTGGKGRVCATSHERYRDSPLPPHPSSWLRSLKSYNLPGKWFARNRFFFLLSFSCGALVYTYPGEPFNLPMITREDVVRRRAFETCNRGKTRQTRDNIPLLSWIPGRTWGPRTKDSPASAHGRGLAPTFVKTVKERPVFPERQVFFEPARAQRRSKLGHRHHREEGELFAFPW